MVSTYTNGMLRAFQLSRLLLTGYDKVAEDSFAKDMNSTSLELHSLRADRNKNEKVVLAIECQTQAGKTNSFM
jgi:hypothetical protein